MPASLHGPEKWRHLSPFGPGKAVDELVCFVDFAPTLISLAGTGAIPPSMQGRPFLGPLRRKAPDGDLVYLSADRFDELPGAPYSTYQLGQAGWTAWRKAWKNDMLAPH